MVGRVLELLVAKGKNVKIRSETIRYVNVIEYKDFSTNREQALK